MGAALAGGAKIAQKAPGVVGKIATVGGVLAAGGAAIVTKNVAGNVSKDIGSNSLISTKVLSDLFGLSGDSVKDLLLMLSFFQNIQLFFLYIITYNYLITLIDIQRVEVFLLKYFNKNIVYYILLFIKLSQKASKLMIICSFILLIFSNLNSYYYLNFFIDNFDAIVEYYSKK